jgi:hypothetical protein
MSLTPLIDLTFLTFLLTTAVVVDNNMSNISNSRNISIISITVNISNAI